MLDATYLWLKLTQMRKDGNAQQPLVYPIYFHIQFITCKFFTVVLFKDFYSSYSFAMKKIMARSLIIKRNCFSMNLHHPYNPSQSRMIGSWHLVQFARCLELHGVHALVETKKNPLTIMYKVIVTSFFILLWRERCNRWIWGCWP